MNLFRTEPALTLGTITGIIVALCAIFIPDIDAGTVESAIAALVPVLTAIFIRPKVTPVEEPIVTASRRR